MIRRVANFFAWNGRTSRGNGRQTGIGCCWRSPKKPGEQLRSHLVCTPEFPPRICADSRLGTNPPGSGTESVRRGPLGRGGDAFKRPRQSASGLRLLAGTGAFADGEVGRSQTCVRKRGAESAAGRAVSRGVGGNRV